MLQAICVEALEDCSKHRHPRNPNLAPEYKGQLARGRTCPKPACTGECIDSTLSRLFNVHRAPRTHNDTELEAEVMKYLREVTHHAADTKRAFQ
jgi:hypothetical protein